ncbi:MAG: single-stranded DNA-binding protein [bacterium]|nr:single-stranded DNA-binding protein [bacterium]
MYINKAFIFGNLTRDPEVRALPSGIKVCNFSLATNRSWKDKNGARQESVDYHNIVMFGKLAETASQYLKKGSSIFVEGRMQTRSWDAPDGQKKYRTEVIADSFQFGPKTSGSGSGESYAGTGSNSAPSKVGTDKNAVDAVKSGDVKPSASIPAEGAIEYPEEEINADDIPF